MITVLKRLVNWNGWVFAARNLVRKLWAINPRLVEVNHQKLKHEGDPLLQTAKSEPLNKINTLNTPAKALSFPLYKSFLHIPSVLPYNQNKEKQFIQNENWRDWKTWKGKVLATKEDIKGALKIIDHKPKNADELEEFIFKQHSDRIFAVLEKGKNSLY